MNPPRLRRAAAAAAIAVGALAGLVPAFAVPIGVQTPPTLPAPLVGPGSPIVPATAAGYLPDTPSVTPGGTFTDTIALAVPAGRAGMAPELALHYDSSAGDGLVGVGWSLSGVGSRITRCGRSLSTEGTVDGVSYTTDDRYCLDGTKLIAVGALDYGSGAYGDIDTEYRTETDWFAQIVSTGSGQTIASGPDAFIVRTHTGFVLTYTPQTGTRKVSGASLST